MNIILGITSQNYENITCLLNCNMLWSATYDYGCGAIPNKYIIIIIINGSKRVLPSVTKSVLPSVTECPTECDMHYVTFVIGVMFMLNK